MVKIFILILGVVLFVVGAQDLVRIVINPQDGGLWGNFTDEYFARIILNLVLMASGIMDVIIYKRKDSQDNTADQASDKKL